MANKAFPSAYGGGANATGGRGQTVYHVTNLNSSGSGSLADAVSQSNRYVVFDVSGTISMAYWVMNGKSNITIAGQTAPAGGITITSNVSNATFQMTNCNNIIIRYLRFRWSINHQKIGIDIYGHTTGCYDIILDHISESYAGWTGLGVRGVNSRNITFQNSIIGESKNGSVFGDSDSSSYSYDNSFLNNFFYNVSHRFPNPNSDGRVDVINNVVQNPHWRLCSNTHAPKLNHINNYVAYGNQNSIGFSQMNRAFESNDNEIYSVGNIIDKGVFTDPNADNNAIWSKWAAGSETQLLASSEFVDTMHPLIGVAVPIKTATEAYNDITTSPHVGCSVTLNDDGSVSSNYDQHDIEYLATTALGEGNEESYYLGSSFISDSDYDSPQRYADFQASISSTPINTRAEGFYNNAKSADIPEAWYDAQGLTTELSTDLAPSGYTWIEEYHNEVDSGAQTISIPVITLIGQSTINLTIGDSYTEQGATAFDSEDGDLTGSIVIAGDTVDPNTIGSYVVTYTVEDSDLNETIVTRTVNVSLGNIPIISVTNETLLPESTNFISYSEDFTQAYWQKWDITLEVNSIVAPDGNTTATKLIATNNTAFHNIKISEVQHNTTLIMRAKKGTLDFVQFIDTYGATNSVATFNLDLGTAVIFSGLQYSNPTIEDVGDGWYKCSVDVSTHENTHINITNGNNDGNVALTDADYLYIWGVEQKDIDNNYIYTNGSIVTVAAASYTSTLQGQAYVDDGATASDVEDGDISGSVVTTGTVDTNTVGTYNLFYDVVDSDGNNAPQKSREVRVLASGVNIPIITRTDTNPDSYTVGDTFLGITGTYTDAEAPTSGDAILNIGDLDMNVAGVYNVTLFHTDADGNTGSLIVPITVNAKSGNIKFNLNTRNKLKRGFY